VTDNFLTPLFNFFGKRLAKTPPDPANLDIAQFNSTTQEWELVNAPSITGVQSSSNVGSGDGLALPRVLDDLPFKSLTEGDNITLTPSATEIEIKSKNIIVMGYHSDKNWKVSMRFGAMFTNKSDEAVEAEAQGFFDFPFTVTKITVFVSNNVAIDSSSITLKRNSVLIPATTITIPALTTGKFTKTVSESFASLDEIHEEHIIGALAGDNDVKNTSYYLEVTSP